MRLDVGPILRTFRRQPAVLALVVFEIAAGVATIAALLLSGSWYGRIGAVPSGLDERNLIVVSTYGAGAEDVVDRRQRDELTRVRALPGVVAATSVSTTILDGRWTYPALLRGAREDFGWVVFTDAEVQRTLKQRVLAGAWEPDEPTVATDPARAAILTRCLAERLFGGVAAALGGQVSSDQSPPVPVRAVVADVTMRVPFMPHSKCVAFVVGGAPLGHEARLLVRAADGQAEAVGDRVRGALADGPGRDASVYVEVEPLRSSRGLHHRLGHGLSRLFSTYGALVGVIALLGALAATSFLVAERRRQIGIRRALGGTKSDIVGAFLIENVLVLALGSLLGLCGAALLFLLMQPVLLGLSVDRGLLASGLGLFWLATLAATLIPALRAARVPPSVASRSL